MKTLAILGIIAGVLLIGGLFMASAGVFDSDQKVESSTTVTSCSEGGCPTGGCTASSNCGLSTCGAKTGGSCGCQ